MSNRSRWLASVFAAMLAVLFFSTAPASAAPGKPSPAAPASAAADQGAALAAVPAASTDAHARIQSRVSAYVATHGTRYSFADYVDPATGRVVLQTDAPADVVASVTDLGGTATTATAQAARATLVQRATTSDAFNRRDDTPPFWGGGDITDRQFLCSDGFAIHTAGVVRMVTAGHCFANGTTVLTESAARVEGTVGRRHLDSITHDKKDMELIGGQSYAGRIFTGGVTSTTSRPVHGAGAAVVGFTNYCHSGRTTGERCGHTDQSNNAQVCTSTGCKQPVIAYTGGVLQQGGDSGGTFYVYSNDGQSVFIRGHVLAGNNTTGYIEPWAVMQSTYSATIVTG